MTFTISFLIYIVASLSFFIYLVGGKEKIGKFAVNVSVVGFIIHTVAMILRIIESKGKKTDKISYELKGSFLYSPEKVTPTIFDGLPSRIIEFDTKGNYKNIRGASI